MTTRWARRVWGSALLALLAGTLLSAPRAAHALGACDWRRPDQDIKILFPGADDYHPIYKRTFQRREEIESRLGYQLAGWEDLIRYYVILKDDQRVGTVYVHRTHGGIEIVVAFTNDGAVKGVLLQRYLGRQKAQMEGNQFLGQFVGKKLTAPLELGKDIKAAGPGLEGPSEGIALTVKKLLVFYQLYG